MLYRDLLKTRIPEYLQGDNELSEYLEAAGELFDEYESAIKAFDNYTDYKLAPETRLQDLARNFAMEFPRNLNEDLQRTILRDLEEIYRKNGSEDVINWIFRLIGWDVELQKAWVLNPERYDPRITQEKDLDNYDGIQTEPVFTDFFRQDYRNFLIGQEFILDNGTYFTGRQFFDLEDTFENIEIVGETYDKNTKFRTSDKVMSTPYLFIRVSEESYNIFTSPYTDPTTGETYDYTRSEFFRIVENILNFFLYDAHRPTHVRVVIIVTAQQIQDDLVIEEEFIDDFTSKPVDMEESYVMRNPESSILGYSPQVGTLFLAGAPLSPFNKDMVLSSVSTRALTTDEGFRIHTDIGKYISIDFPNDYPVIRAGSSKFNFITPHEEDYPFRRVFLSESSLSFNVTNGVIELEQNIFENDDSSLSLMFDATTDSYGIVEPLEEKGIIVRNPTQVTSPHFKLAEVQNEYVIGLKDQSGNFRNDMMMSMDFREEETTYMADVSDKTFTYNWSGSVYKKTTNLQDNWEFLTNDPTENELNRMTNSNTILLVFNQLVPYDFVLNIKYLKQPTWENRE